MSRDRIRKRTPSGASSEKPEPRPFTTWTRASWGADDLDAWRVQARLAPVGSPLRPMVLGQVARLERAHRARA